MILYKYIFEAHLLFSRHTLNMLCVLRVLPSIFSSFKFESENSNYTAIEEKYSSSNKSLWFLSLSTTILLVSLISVAINCTALLDVMPSAIQAIQIVHCINLSDSFPKLVIYGSAEKIKAVVQ